jgi:hypothetical protein
MDEKDFKVRAYGKTELALMYNPDCSQKAAMDRLRTWINTYPGLNDKLKSQGYSKTQHLFSPAQVKTIVDALGEP